MTDLNKLTKSHIEITFLEKVLLEMDVEGWTPWKDRSNDFA